MASSGGAPDGDQGPGVLAKSFWLCFCDEPLQDTYLLRNGHGGDKITLVVTTSLLRTAVATSG